MTRKIFTSLLFCLTAIIAWAVEPTHNPFIESLNGSVSGNTLTLIATMNYDNIQGQIESSVQYHWKKGGVEQTGAHNNVFTDNNAFTPTDITWEVWATYTYQGVQKQTETVTYIQKRPTITLYGFSEGNDYKLTATLNTCGVEVNDVRYFYLSEESDTQTGTEFTSSSRVGNAINFEGRMWWVYATFTYGGKSYRSYCRSYEQEPSPTPVLSVTKREDKHDEVDQLVMDATLTHEYGTNITDIQYHWSKNGGTEEINKTSEQTSPHSFATQNWSCYATFQYDSKTYQTNTETYTYYSTLGHVMVKIEVVGDKYKAVLYKADEHGESTGEVVDLQGQGASTTYNWKLNLNPSGSYGTTQEVAKPTQAGVVWIECKVTLKDTNNESLEKFRVKLLDDKAECVVYLDPTNGNNSNSGFDRENPVKDWATAYKRLPPGGTWDNNIIVVTGTLPLTITESHTQGIAATITGVWPWNDMTGAKITSGGVLTMAGTARTTRIGADTRFKNVCFTSNGSDSRLALFLHDTMFDVGCIMNNCGTLATNMGAMDTKDHKAPSFHLMLFSDENDFTAAGTSNNAAWNQTKPMELTIKSGRFGRILCTRIAGTNAETQIKKRYVVGKPDMPLMAKIVVDIDPTTATNEYNPSGYKDDIAFLCAGTTQGAVYADMQMNIYRGKIATIVAGSQGNAIAGCVTAKLPTSSYFGRTTVNVQEYQDNDVTIYRYFGGCLGRFTGGEASGECKAYFYGHSTLNLIKGTIEQNLFASAGGLSGLKNPNESYNGEEQHTSDAFIPYQGGTIATYPYLGIDYNTYNAGKTIVKVKSKLNGKEESIDLADTRIVFNVKGGIIKGNVYGGSYGYSSEMNVGNSPRGAGSLWGNTEINISGGAIKGNVYGGGGGSTEYYNQETKNKTKFTNVASVYGNTNVSITGTPDIAGNIYGGGAGVPYQAAEDGKKENEFLDIAKVYGNTNILFNADYTDDNPFTGNIYGGGAKGGVEGNTNVIISKGVIVGNVYGGSQGEEGHPNKAKVVGTTKVVIGE